MYGPGLCVLAVLNLSLFSAAQNFTIPASWRKPTSSLDRNDRLSLVSGVLSSLVPAYNSTSGQYDGLSYSQTASLLSVMSTGDLINSSSTNRDAVINSLNTVFSLTPNISTIWGLAAIDSYRTYANPSSLTFAQSMWTLLEPFQIQPAQAAAGTHPLKTAGIQSTCYGASTAGGVFYLTNTPGNTDVNGETVAVFLVLSARLFEATSDTQYQTAAELSAEFIMNQLYSGGIILDTITVANCFRNNDILTYNSGFTIEGLSVLATKNASWTPFLNSLISTAVTNGGWTNTSDGVIYECNGCSSNVNTNEFDRALKGIFIRGLYEASSRSPNGSAVAEFVEAYITVQFNAQQDRASTTGTPQFYSPQWEGPPPSQFLPWGQLAALDVLNSIVGFSASGPSTGPSSSSTTQPSGSPTPGSSSNAMSPSPTSDPQNPGLPGAHKSSHTAAIVGGIIGGTVVAALICTMLVIFRRRRRRSEVEYARTMLEETPVPYSSRPHVSSPTVDAMAEVHTDDEIPRIFRHVKDKYRPVTVPSHDPALASSSQIIAPSPEPEPVRPSNAIVAPDETRAAVPSMNLSTGGRPSTTDFNSVPALIDRLNRIMSALPLGGIEEDAPPQYEG